MKKSSNLLLAMAFLFGINAFAQIPTKLESFNVSDVTLTESVFKHAEDMDIQYLMAINPDRLLAPFLKEAGLEPKAENYTNWENTGLDGHVGGHYLSALAYIYASTGNQEIKGRLDYCIAELKRCADATGNGYISGVPGGNQTWKEISEGNIRPSSFNLNGKWVPLYNIHKTFAGLRDVYLITGNKDAKEMFINLTEWMYQLTKELTDDQIQHMLSSEHGGLNEVFADAAAISGEERYMELAKRFSHKRVLEPLLNGEDRLTGMHANTQIPKVIGYKRIADLEGNTEWDKAAQYFWETVVDNRSITIGGNSVSEHFHPANDFSSMLTSEQGPETCNTYNMLRLTKMLYATTANSHYMDYYERAVYNHILSTINPIQGGFVYFTPMRAGHYRVYSQPQTSFWCCAGSGMENHARYGEMIYSHAGDDNLYIILFIPSILNWGKTTIEQVNKFPEEEATTIIVTPKKAKEFTINVRIPEWTEASKMVATVNGEKCNVDIENGFMKITRKWNKGDKLHIDLPMSLRAVSLPDNSANYSFMYGPIVLAAEINRQDQLGMYADDSRGGHIASGKKLPLQDMPTIVGDKDNLLSYINKVDDKSLKFKLTNIVPNNFGDMTLVPFTSLHECRYIVYWPVVAEKEWQAKQEELARQEEARIALEKITSDKVVCGEQQPESDHFVKMENSRNGDTNGRHWRSANGTGWFSYDMKHYAGSAALLINCNTSANSDAAVLVNGVEVGVIASTEQRQEQTIKIELSEEVSKESVLTVKFMPKSKNSTPLFYEVRLIKAAE